MIYVQIEDYVNFLYFSIVDFALFCLSGKRCFKETVFPDSETNMQS